MTIRRVSIILPCQRLDSFPTRLVDREAADLLAAWTTAWHPALTHTTGRLPVWHPVDDLPDPASLEGELVLVPSVTRQRLASDWCDRLRATAPLNPPPVEPSESRANTVAAVLEAASIAPDSVGPELVADFLALGYTHLQVELLTRAMRYSTVLDTDQFEKAVVSAAHAAVAGDDNLAREELGRAFDLLADAREHVYGADIYLVDVTLLAAATLGEALRAKLAAGFPVNLLASGELWEKLARDEPVTLAAVRTALANETACLLGGPYQSETSPWDSPETLRASLERTRQTIAQHFDAECAIFAQYGAAFSSLLPEILSNLGFQGALHATFDGSALPRAEQCKTRWGANDGAWIESLSATPLDLSRPETWLKFAEHLGDSIAHDHVATVLLAGWPGQHSDYYTDVQRTSRYAPVLGKLLTLDEYFRVTRHTDDWTSFAPREYPLVEIPAGEADPIASRVDSYRRGVQDVYQQLAAGLVSIIDGATPASSITENKSAVVLNPWNFAATSFVGVDPTKLTGDAWPESAQAAAFVPDVPACGYAQTAISTDKSVSLVEGNILRNELLELTVSATTGGVQALRTHRDRGTRVSQRLVFHRHRPGHDVPTMETRMVADRVEVTRNDGRLVGEITSHGRLLDMADQLLARFKQSVRLARDLPAAIVEVELEPVQPPGGDPWNTYFASRLAWLDEAVSFRRGVQWQARETGREKIDSPEFVEISNGVGNIVCFGLGLPFHRRPSTTWLDTLLPVAGQAHCRFQFALGLDCTYPTQAALQLATAGTPKFALFSREPAQPRGWLLHLGARNLIITHLGPLDGERSGIRCRILETEGREVATTLSAYRAFSTARTTDFRGEAHAVLSIVDGQARFEIGPYRWIQIEAEW